METRKRYEIMDGLPPYGTMHTPVPSDNLYFFSEGFVVRFWREDGTTWIANFALGWTHITGVFELSASEELLVVAGGICYIIHPDKTVPKSVFGVDYVAIFDTHDGRYVLHGHNTITVVTPDGNHWDSEWMPIDGLKDTVLDGSILKGLADSILERNRKDSDSWVEFAYDIDRRVLIRP